MIVIWTILIVISALALVHLINLIRNYDTEEFFIILVGYLFIVFGIGWLLCGNLVSLSTVKHNITKDVNITRTNTTTIVSYQSLINEKYDDVKTYKYLNKDSCDIFFTYDINMYKRPVNKKIIINFKY